MAHSTIDPFGCRTMYGVVETNAVDPNYDWKVDHGRFVKFEDENLVKILRLRLLSDQGWSYPYWDVSYCYGEMRDGTRVHVILPVRRFSKYASLSGQLDQMAKRAGRYAKGMGLLSAVSTLE